MARDLRAAAGTTRNLSVWRRLVTDRDAVEARDSPVRLSAGGTGPGLSEPARDPTLRSPGAARTAGRARRSQDALPRTRQRIRAPARLPAGRRVSAHQLEGNRAAQSTGHGRIRDRTQPEL